MRNEEICKSSQSLLGPSYVLACHSSLLGQSSVSLPDSPGKPGQLSSLPCPRPKSITPTCHGCCDIQGSEFLISEHSGHWIQFSRVLIILKHCFMLFCCIEKLVLKLESFCPMSGETPDFVAAEEEGDDQVRQSS